MSGDILGSGLIAAIKKKIPQAHFVGIGGPRMQAQGCDSLFPMERLAVMGIVEVFGRIFELLRIRRKLVNFFVSNPPDIFIGIDSPDFNLKLEKKLKQAGIPTIHYVSPTVWAWRGYRIRGIGKSVDHMLTLFPFEADYYHQHQIAVTFVGHPMAETIGIDLDRRRCREQLGVDLEKTVITVLPGSRTSELHRHSELFVKTILWLHHRHADYQFLIPFVDQDKRQIFDAALTANDAGDLPITEIEGQSHQAMAAADIILLVSGTAALEAALIKRVMVVTYKVSFLTAWLVRRFSQIKLYSLPNNLAGEELVPEFIDNQAGATPKNMGAAIERLLLDPQRMSQIESRLGEIGAMMRQNASEKAATVIIDLLATKKREPAVGR